MRRPYHLFLLLLLALAGATGARAQDRFPTAVKLQANADGKALLTVSFTVPPGHYLYVDRIDVGVPEGLTLTPHDVPAGERKFDEIMQEELALYKHDVEQVYQIKGELPETLDVTVSYQGCEDKTCFLPQTREFTVTADGASAAAQEQTQTPDDGNAADSEWRALAEQFEVSAREVGFMNTTDFLDFLDRAGAEDAPGAGQSRIEQALTEGGIWLTAVLILLGGLALNLTPCVLPMIPINIAIIGGGAAASSKARGVLVGTVYGAGMAVVYGVLGVVVVLTGSRFGAINSSPWFNLAVAAVFVVLALAMFDVIHIDFSRLRGSTQVDKEKRGSLLLALFMGGLAALLAGACVAPVLISVLLLAAKLHAAGNTLALFLPFLLGIGMALPWPVLGGGLSLLPKPGKWMEYVKYAFGVAIVGFGIYYAVLGISLLRPQEDHVPEGWHATLAPALQEALDNDKRVFIEVTTAGCKSCKALEKFTLSDEEVKDRLQDYVRLKFRSDNADNPRAPAINAYYDIEGAPTLIVLTPKP